MSITITAKGVAYNDTTPDVLTSGLITLTTGNTLSVLVGMPDSGDLFEFGNVTATWNGTPLTLVVFSNAGSAGGLGLFFLHNVTGGTAPVIVTFGLPPSETVACISEISGLDTPSDHSVGGGTGADTVAGALNILPNSQASEIVVGGVTFNSALSNIASNLNSCVTGQSRDGHTFCIVELYRIHTSIPPTSLIGVNLSVAKTWESVSADLLGSTDVPVRVSGYTSYSTGRILDGSPEAQVPPEVGQRIARGDRRFMGQG